MKLSVLICSLPNRLKNYWLIENLTIQAKSKPVEIIYLGDNKSMTVGEKRQKLLEMASGEYVCFVDDDDEIADDYIDTILDLAKTGKEALCFGVQIRQNGGNSIPVDYSIHNKHRNERHCHYRNPNHLIPVKLHKALKGGFEPYNFGEDKKYSDTLLKYLVDEVKTDKVLYIYHANDKTSETRTKENIVNSNALKGE